MATLHYTFSIKGLADECFVVRGFEGQEVLSDDNRVDGGCHGFRYDIELASRHTDLKPEQVIDATAVLTLYRNGEVAQRCHGVVKRFTQGDIGHHHTFYSLTLVPALERLALRHNSRIFQHKTVQDIIAELLLEMGVEDHQFSLSRKLEEREFCVQYRETDLAFIERLAAEEGLVYYFAHSQDKHMLIFCDDNNALPALEAPVVYNNTGGGEADTPYVWSFTKQTQTAVSDVYLKDYSFKKPAYSFMQQQVGDDMAYQRQTYQHFDAPGRYKDDANGRAYSQARLDYLRRDARLATGQSNQPLLRAGTQFTLSEHLAAEMNADWLVVSITRKGEQPQALEEAGSTGQTTYSNQFKVVPVSTPWRATPQPKPQVDGPMMATVVGPEGEEIFCDEHGRVKVHFPWDRESEKDEHSSCWVRVSQGWAGAQYGFMAIPRIGHEVIVSFLNGDPDQPIITGRTYHATNTPPYPLPQHKTKTVWRSDSHQGEGYNELSFEDQADSERVYLKAQKDNQVEVGNSQHIRVNYDHKLDIGHDENHVVANDRTLTVEGAQSHATKGNHVSEINGDKHQQVDGDWAANVASAIGFNADGDITIKSGAKITLQVGGSFVVIDSSGVAIDGAQILLKSGGSPGGIPLPSSPATLSAAAAEGSAFVANCPPSEG